MIIKLDVLAKVSVGSQVSEMAWRTSHGVSFSSPVLATESSARRVRDVCERYMVNIFGSDLLSFVFDKECCSVLGSGAFGKCFVAQVSSSQWVSKRCGD